MKVHNIIAFLLVGVATATYPPYAPSSSTSAHAQVGKAILVRLPVDSHDAAMSRYYPSESQEYHDPQPTPSPRGKSHYDTSSVSSSGYGYAPKLPESQGNYQEQNSRDNYQSQEATGQQQGYNYGARTAPEHKLVLIVPEPNKDVQNQQRYDGQSSSYSNVPASNYGKKTSSDDAYAKPASSTNTQYQEKKNRFQSNRHHKVPLILITLKDDKKEAKHASQQSRRIAPSYGKSWLPMAAPVTTTQNQDKLSYEPEQWQSKNVQKSTEPAVTGTVDSWRSNQQTSYNNDWQQDQPIRQESYKQEAAAQVEDNRWRDQSKGNADNVQYQTQTPIRDEQYDRPQKNQQSTEEAYDQWKPEANVNAKDQAYDSNRGTYYNNQEQRYNNDNRPVQSQYGQRNNYQSNQNQQQNYQSNQNQEQNYQSNQNQQQNYQSNQNQEQNYQQNAQSTYEQNRPVQSFNQDNYQQTRQEPEQGYNKYKSGSVQYNGDSKYQQHANDESRYPQQQTDTSYQQTSSENRYPQQQTGTSYQTSNSDNRYPQQQQQQQQQTDTSYQTPNSDNRYPQQQTDTSYQQTSSENRYPQQTSENRYQHSNSENKFQQPNTESRHQQPTQSPLTYAQGYNLPASEVINQQPIKGGNNQQVQVWSNQPTTRSPVEEPWTNRPSSQQSNSQNNKWIEDSASRGSEESYRKQPENRPYNQGYTAQESVAGPQAEQPSWDTQPAPSERRIRTRAEKTKGVVLLLLSGDDKDTYARRVDMGSPEVTGPSATSV